MSHYDETGQEIWEQTDGKVDYVIMGVGTGGTITGVARKLKEKNSAIKVIGVDPPGSILASDPKMNEDNPAAPGGQVTEGTGYDFIPRCYQQEIVDDFIKGPDQESFIMARRLMKEEGLMCGGSSGQAMWGAIQYIKKHNIGKGKTVVVLLADGIRNYMTKHLSADWMYERGYISEKECTEAYTDTLIPNEDWGQDLKVKDLKLNECVFMKSSDTCEHVLSKMREYGFEQFPVKDEEGATYGQITEKQLLMRLTKKHVELSGPIKRAVTRDLRTVSKEMSLNELSRVLVRTNFAVIEDKYCVHITDVLEKFAPKAVAATAKE
jgi:cystathionine beta-synthase